MRFKEFGDYGWPLQNPAVTSMGGWLKSVETSNAPMAKSACVVVSMHSRKRTRCVSGERPYWRKRPRIGGATYLALLDGRLQLACGRRLTDAVCTAGGDGHRRRVDAHGLVHAQGHRVHAEHPENEDQIASLAWYQYVSTVTPAQPRLTECTCGRTAQWCRCSRRPWPQRKSQKPAFLRRRPARMGCSVERPRTGAAQSRRPQPRRWSAGPRPSGWLLGGAHK